MNHNSNPDNQNITDMTDIEKLTDQIKTKAHRINFNLNNSQIQQLISYLKLIQKWNKAYNLTAITDTDKILEYHFIDCLQICDQLKNYQKILDVGTGAGFPGLIIAIASSNNISNNISNNQNNSIQETTPKIIPKIIPKISLLDKNGKKVKFLKQVCHQIGLNNTQCMHSRVEQLASKSEKFDAIISRAVTQLIPFFKITEPLLAPGGSIYLMQGRPNKDQQQDFITSYPGWKLNIINLPTLVNGEVRHLIKLNQK